MSQQDHFLLTSRKYFNIKVSELKLRLYRKIDTLDKSKLEEVYSVLTNYINGQKDIPECINYQIIKDM